MSHPSELLARSLLSALISAGVRDVVYCPGSRSAPLAYALAAAVDAGLVRAHVRLDERSACFLAVGLSRAGRRDDSSPDDPALRRRPAPVAIVTTSGGAVAELHAGVAEAHHSRLPLIVVSADRPAEMQGVGASQTTTQAGIFGPHARACLDLPADSLPGPSLSSRIGRVLARAQGLPSGSAGPVQINIAFRDPLTPEGGSLEAPPFSLVGSAPARVHPSPPVPLEWDEAVQAGLRTVIVAGDAADPEASRWAAAAGLPILAEPTSGLAFDELRIPFEQSLLESGLAERIEQVIVTGRPTLSRPVSALLARRDLRIIVVDPTNEWTDVAGAAALVVPALAAPPEAPEGRIPDDSWLEQWRALARSAGERIGGVLDAAPLSVLHAARTVWSADSRTLFLGASNSVRAADLVGERGRPRRVVSNRGLAGIDGTIASAMGLALGTEEPVTALMGDLSFFHDAGALAVPADEPTPDLLILVADDGGGGIFRGLEHGRSENAPTFTRWFATPQRTSIEGLARAHGLAYREASTQEELRALVERAPRGVVVCRIVCSHPDELQDVKKAAQGLGLHSKRTDQIQ